MGFGLGASSMVNNVRWKNPDEHMSYTDCVEKMGDGGCDGRTFESGSAPYITRLKEKSYVEMLRRTGRCEVQILASEEQMEEFMFLGLRLTEGVDQEEFRRNFGKTVEDIYGKQIRSFLEKGLLEREGKRLRLTPRGIDVSNVVFAAFLF